MATNKFELEINAPIDKIWEALTNSVEFSKWMKSVKVQSTWKQGAEITYTCYTENGEVLKWEGMEMIWEGRISVFDKNKELTCVYPSKSTGLVEESYFLETVNERQSKLIQVQILSSQEIANGYKEGTSQTLALLKNHLEKL